MMKIAVLISGRGSNMRSLVQFSLRPESSFKVGLVLSQNPESEGLIWAQKQNIPTEVLSTKMSTGRLSEIENKTLVKILCSYQVDLVCLAGFLKLVGADFLSSFPDQVINIHPSLLPSFKGLDAPLQALKYGVKKAGCTVHFVDEKMDTGPIIAQKVVDVFDDDTEPSLVERILKEEHQLYPWVVQKISQKQVLKEGRRVRLIF